MGQSQPEANPRKVVTTKIDVRDATDRLDPTRHDPTTEYEFSSGRKFKRIAGESYE